MDALLFTLLPQADELLIRFVVSPPLCRLACNLRPISLKQNFMLRRGIVITRWSPVVGMNLVRYAPVSLLRFSFPFSVSFDLFYLRSRLRQNRRLFPRMALG